MITTSCDLACPGCDRFIDYDHRWFETMEEFSERMQKWSKRLSPQNLTLIGGEPLINPNLFKMIDETRRIFPSTNIELFTNGFLLEKKSGLIEKLFENQPSAIHVSLHNRNERIREKLNQNVNNFLIKDYQWTKTGVNSVKCENVQIQIEDVVYEGWQDYRRIVNGRLKPFNDGDPAQSYSNCGVNIFPIVYKGEIYKCPPISMLRDQAKKMGFEEDIDWEPYLNYRGISYDCSEKDLKMFVKNIFEPHTICGMCPANPEWKEQPEAIVKGRHHEM